MYEWLNSEERLFRRDTSALHRKTVASNRSLTAMAEDGVLFAKGVYSRTSRYCLFANVTIRLFANCTKNVLFTKMFIRRTRRKMFIAKFDEKCLSRKSTKNVYSRNSTKNVYRETRRKCLSRNSAKMFIRELCTLSRVYLLVNVRLKTRIS